GPVFSNYYVNSSPSFDGTGWGFTAGAGYDIRVGRDVSLTPVVNYVYGGVGDVNESGVGRFATGWKQYVIDFGLGVTFHCFVRGSCLQARASGRRLFII